MSYVLALDQGTTSSRALLFDHDGRIVANAQREFPQLFPQPGWVEHDPMAIWSSQLDVAREAMASLGVTAADLAAIGIANQRETALVWERATGRPVYNAIVWQDRRTAPACEALREAGHEPAFQARTGLILDPYFAGTKVAWILDNVPGARVQAEAGALACGTVDSWLAWQLTGGRRHVTDATNASRTLGFDIKTMAWDDELLALLRLPRSLLPEVVGTSEVIGETLPELLGAPLPVASLVGDQQAALFGQMCTTPGMVKNTYGTGCFLLMATGEQPVTSSQRLLTTVASKIGDRVDYALEGSIFVAGAVVQWLRDGLGIIESSEQVETLAAGVEDNGGVYFVPALAGLGAPHWDPSARGTIVGLTRGTTRGHIARAALESLAYQTADVIAAMEADSGLKLTELRVDGGASRNDLLMQFQADILGVPVVRPQITETTAAGAAYLAGLAVGFWRDLDEIQGHWRAERRFEPRMSREDAAALFERWSQAVPRSMGWERS